MSSGWVVISGVTVVAYLMGTLPAAQLVASRAGRDPTVEGSHNPGASNVYRLVGWRSGAIVLMIDLSKGAAAAALGYGVGGRDLALAAGVFAVLGHVAPVTRRLRGGKGVATAGGMALVLWPVAAVILGMVFLVVVFVVRIASVGSLVVALGLPLVVGLSGGRGVEVGVAAVVAVLVIARHHDNIGRLIRGEEGQTTHREL